MAPRAIRIALPAGYSVADVLKFHSRDAEGVAKVVTADGLRKGVMLGGLPVVLDQATHCGFPAPDKSQDTTAIQRRRFVAAPRHAGNDYWRVERRQKNRCCQLF
jgi:hypothetical protein